jgi:hypothetical protein
MQSLLANMVTKTKTEQETMDIDAFVQNFRESQKEREEEVEDENDIVLEEEKCSVKTSGCCQKFKGTAGICCTTE